jgi:hypothetical protein
MKYTNIETLLFIGCCVLWIIAFYLIGKINEDKRKINEDKRK